MKFKPLVLAAALAAVAATSQAANPSLGTFGPLPSAGGSPAFVAQSGSSNGYGVSAFAYTDLFDFTLVGPAWVNGITASISQPVSSSGSFTRDWDYLGAPVIVDSSNSVVGTFGDASSDDGIEAWIMSDVLLLGGTYTLKIIGSVGIQGDGLDVAGSDVGVRFGAYSGTLNITPVPEPESYALFLAGLGLMGLITRRRSA